MPNIVPEVPLHDPGQSQIFLNDVRNPLLGVWYTTQTVSQVPENVMGWLVAQGYEVTGITQDTSTTPPTNYFSLTKEGMDHVATVVELCNSYTIAANDAKFANEARYNEIILNWSQMILSTHAQFDAQTEEQNSQAGVFMADLDEYMSAIETLINDSETQITIEAAEAKEALEYINGRLTELEENAAASAITIRELLSGLGTNVNTYVAEIEAILALLDADYVSVEADLSAIKVSTGTLADAFAVDYQSVLDQLSSDFIAHENIASDFLDGLGATELDRINEEFASQLSIQLQALVSRGLSSSAIVADITERNHRDRDEQIQLLNDRLMREKLGNKHQLYQQQFSMRTRTLDGINQLHGVRQEVLKYQASLISTTYELLQNIRNRILAGQQAILAARDANVRLGIEVNSTLLDQLQTAFNGVLGGKERFSTLLMQNASTLVELKHKIIVERMETAVKRLDGWKSVADDNRRLMAYQLDERNKLLIGLYSFVERREDIGPTWNDGARVIAALGDAGGWMSP